MCMYVCGKIKSISIYKFIVHETLTDSMYEGYKDDNIHRHQHYWNDGNPFAI